MVDGQTRAGLRRKAQRAGTLTASDPSRQEALELPSLWRMLTLAFPPQILHVWDSQLRSGRPLARGSEPRFSILGLATERLSESRLYHVVHVLACPLTRPIVTGRLR